MNKEYANLFIVLGLNIFYVMFNTFNVIYKYLKVKFQFIK